MVRIVKRLPKRAKYDFTNEFGEKIYHTNKRRYMVVPNNWLMFKNKFTVYSGSLSETSIV